MANFDRQYRLSAGQGGAEGFEIGGDNFPLHISFSVEKTDLTSQNTAQVAIWNLNPSQIAELEQKDCIVTLKAGYETTIPLIFAGVVTYVSTGLDGANLCTEIELVDNRIEIRDTFVSLSYADVISTKTVLEDVAGQMGVTPTFAYNAEFSDFQNGFSFIGAGKDALSKACDSSDLTWSIQNGVLQIKKPGDVMAPEVYVLSPDTGLVNIPKKVQIADEEGTDEAQNGIDVEYLMNAAINIDDYVKLESKYMEGYFRVYSLAIEGDTHSATWKCTARLLEVSG